MSLINQMLKDLESRHASGDLAQRAAHGMGAAARQKQKKQSVLLLGLFVLVAVLASTSAYLLWLQPQEEDDQQVVAEPASTTVATESEKTAATESPAMPVTKAPRQRTEEVPLVKKSPVTVPIMKTPAGKAGAEVEAEDAPADDKEPPSNQVETQKRVVNAQSKSSAATIKKHLRPQTKEQLAEKQYQQGYALLQRGDRKGAEEAWRKALQIDAKHAASRESLAILYLSQSRRVEAAEQLQKGLDVNPGNSKLALLYARMQLDTGDPGGAIATLEKAMQNQAQTADFYAFIAAIYQRQSEYEKSVAAYQAALKQQSNQSVWWMGLGISLEGAGKNKEALTAYQQAARNGLLAPKLKQYIEGRIQALE